MQSRNPVIRRAEAQYAEDYSGPGFAAVNAGGATAAGTAQAGQAQYAAPHAQSGMGAPPAQAYGAPAQIRPVGPAMTIHDVIMKTALNFVILVIAAAATWIFISNSAAADAAPGTIPPIAGGIMLVSALAGFGLAMVNIFKKQVSPALIMLYALVEGVLVGSVSFVYQIWGEQFGYGNIVGTAVVATFVVFAVMLTLYTTRIIKVTNRFKKIMFVAMISYLAFAFISFIAGWLFGVGDGLGAFGYGWISVGISALVVVMASFALCLDFDAIEEGMRLGVPERESWRMAFGLMVTIIWLYFEILRLLMLIANASR